VQQHNYYYVSVRVTGEPEHAVVVDTEETVSNSTARRLSLNTVPIVIMTSCSLGVVSALH